MGHRVGLVFVIMEYTEISPPILSGTATRLRAGQSMVRLPVGAGNFSLHHRVQTVSGAHLASYPIGTRGSFLVGKAAGA